MINFGSMSKETKILSLNNYNFNICVNFVLSLCPTSKAITCIYIKYLKRSQLIVVVLTLVTLEFTILKKVNNNVSNDNDSLTATASLPIYSNKLILPLLLDIRLSKESETIDVIYNLFM